MAHYVLFAGGGFVIYILLESYGIKHKRVIAVFLGMLMAALDEYHQFYSAGRGPQLWDVGLDSLGVISGVLLAIVASKIIFQLKKGKKGYDKFQKNNSRKNCKDS